MSVFLTIKVKEIGYTFDVPVVNSEGNNRIGIQNETRSVLSIDIMRANTASQDLEECFASFDLTAETKKMTRPVDTGEIFSFFI